MMAEKEIARGALQLPYISGPVPVKSNTALPCNEKKNYTHKIIICLYSGNNKEGRWLMGWRGGDFAQCWQHSHPVAWISYQFSPCSKGFVRDSPVYFSEACEFSSLLPPTKFLIPSPTGYERTVWKPVSSPRVPVSFRPGFYFRGVTSPNNTPAAAPGFTRTTRLERKPRLHGNHLLVRCVFPVT